MKTLAALISLGLASSVIGETVAMASKARFWLSVPNEHPPLRNVTASNGHVRNAHWEKNPALRERQMDVEFPIRWWSWSEMTVRFQPEYDGPLTLTLNGPWVADGMGECQRQEVLWDGVSAEGTTIRNGGFEMQTDRAPEAWSSPWSAYTLPDQWPLALKTQPEGKHVAASWHNRPLQQVIQVKKGTPVSIRFRARAATPLGFIEPKALGNQTPAHQAASTLKRGVNFGNGWESDRSWGLTFTPADVDHVADEGFDHIRIPVAFHKYLEQTEASWRLSPTLLAELEPVLRRAMDRKLKVLLDWHHFDDFTKDPEPHLNRFVSGWQCIAKHFRSWPPGLFYELLNEPHDKLDTPALGPVYQKTIAAIRAIDPKRILVASPGLWGSAGELDQLRLPDNDDRIIVTIHCYDPFHFTHQGAGWVGLQDLKGVVYPGPPSVPLAVPTSLKNNQGVIAFLHAYHTQPRSTNPCSENGIRQALDLAAEWSRHFGRPIHLGEFGAFETGDLASRARYLRDVRKHAEARRIPWALWEWKAGFGYWDSKSDKPRFREELID